MSPISAIAISPEAVNAWFTPQMYILYLGSILVLMTVWYQWKWAKICKANIQVLIAKESGGGDYELAPKDGGMVSIKNPKTGATRLWPVNELATIDVPYPGVGFLPGFMQKQIRLAILNEGDWEPMLNRSPHRENIASPDVLLFLSSIAESNPELKEMIEARIEKVATGPTREMIANPAVLGNLLRAEVIEKLATLGNDMMEALNNITKRLGNLNKLVSPTIVYLGLGLLVLLVAFLLYKVLPMSADLDLIKKSLGIVSPP